MSNLQKKINEKKYSEKLNTQFLSLKSESIADNNKILITNRLMPTTPNEKFQSIFTSLFNDKKYKNKSMENNESINNNGNDFNTQESTVRKTTDYSKITLSSFSPKIIRHPLSEKKDNQILRSSRLDDRFYDQKRMSLLYEIIQEKKNMLQNRLSIIRNKNYNIKALKYIK